MQNLHFSQAYISSGPILVCPSQINDLDIGSHIFLREPLQQVSLVNFFHFYLFSHCILITVITRNFLHLAQVQISKYRIKILNVYQFCQGCHKKAPQTGWLKQRDTFRKLILQDQGSAGRFGFSRAAFLGLQMAFVSLCPYMAFPFVCEPLLFLPLPLRQQAYG